MRVWSVVCFNRVLAFFYTKDDAEQLCIYLKALQMQCITVDDTRSVGPGQMVWKGETSKALLELFDLIDASVI